MDCNAEDWYWVCSGLSIIRRAGTWSVADFRVYGGLILTLQWTKQYTLDWFWVCSGLWILVGLVLGLQVTVRRAGTRSVVECTVNSGPVLGSVLDCRAYVGLGLSI